MRYTTCSLLLPVVLLSACQDAPVDYSNLGVDSSSQLRLEQSRTEHAQTVEYIYFTPGTSQIDPVSTKLLSERLGENIQHVTIASPAVDAKKDARILTLVRALRGSGLESGRITTLPAPSQEAEAYRLEFTTVTALSPSECPNWSTDPTSSHSNMPFSNLGCAVVANVSRQARNPDEIVDGRGGAPRPDAPRNAASMSQYQKNADPASPPPQQAGVGSNANAALPAAAPTGMMPPSSGGSAPAQ